MSDADRTNTAQNVNPAAAPPDDLDARLKAAGMLTIEETLRPLNRFQVHAGMRDYDTFASLLVSKARQYARMHAEFTLDDAEDDDLYEWVIAHSNAYHDALVNFHAASIGEMKKWDRLEEVLHDLIEEQDHDSAGGDLTARDVARFAERLREEFAPTTPAHPAPVSDQPETEGEACEPS